MSRDSASNLSRALELIERREYAEAERLLSSLASNENVLQLPLESLLPRVLLLECRAFMGRDDVADESATIVQRLRSGFDHSLYARACLVLGVSLYPAGRVVEAIEGCEQSVATYLRIGDFKGATRALNWLGNIYFNISDFGASIRAYRRCDAIASRENLVRAVCVARQNLSKPVALSGRLKDAADLLESNRHPLSVHADKLNCIRQDLFHAFVLLQMRELARSRELLTECQRHYADLPQREQGAWCEYMGELEMACGNLVEAETYLRRGIAVGSGKSRDESVIGQSRRLLAELRLAQEDLDETMAECERALESILKVGERFEEGCVHRIMGVVHARRNEHAQARAAFKRSLDILRDIGAQFELAKTDLAAGETELFSRRERLAYLAEAERLFEETDVSFWIERARDQLKIVLDDRGEELARSRPLAAGRKDTLFVTSDPDTLKTLEMARRYARRDIAVLITGETGVGKDQLARLIHAASPRHSRPLVAIDLSTIPESLWESELFGHRKGVFTGATADKVGLLQSADGGTVFLNEIGNLPLGLQAKLLEFLDTHQVRRLGELEPITLDVRLIAATNLDLREAVDRGTFRSDLYYRLAQAPLHLRPLRERRSDILTLIRHFMVDYGVPPGEVGLIDRQLWVDRAVNGQWAGNARDLRSFVYRLIALADRPTDPEFPRWAALLVEQIDVIREPASVTREKLIAALDQCGWNQRAAARDLGLSEASVRRLMSRYEIGRDNDLVAADLAHE